MLCIPLQPRSLKELKANAQKAARFADMIEVWVDHLPPEIAAKAIVACCPKPLIVVNKPQREKGCWEGTEKQRIERLKQFALPGVAYLDVGIDTNPSLIKDLIKAKKRTKVIVSYHHFKSTPSAKILQQKVRTALKLGADVIKVATFATKPTDNLTVLSLLNNEKRPTAVMCMGKHGKISRIAGPTLGSHFTFAALNKQKKTAPGQLTAQEYKTFQSLLQ